MTTTVDRPTTTGGSSTSETIGGSKVERKGNIVVGWITSTDHKTIGYMYLIT